MTCNHVMKNFKICILHIWKKETKCILQTMYHFAHFFRCLWSLVSCIPNISIPIYICFWKRLIDALSRTVSNWKSIMKIHPPPLSIIFNVYTMCYNVCIELFWIIFWFMNEKILCSNKTPNHAFKIDFTNTIQLSTLFLKIYIITNIQNFLNFQNVMF